MIEEIIFQKTVFEVWKKALESNVQIRIASPADAEEIARILAQAFAPFERFYTPEAFAATVISPEKIRERFGDEGAIWVALKDEQAVGTVSVVPDGEKLYIRSMAVSPAAQGFGIGRRLLETVDDFAARNGFEKLFLYTTPYLPAAKRLYERSGFKRGAEIDGFFGTPLFAMEKDLKNL